MNELNLNLIIRAILVIAIILILTEVFHVALTGWIAILLLLVAVILIFRL